MSDRAPLTPEKYDRAINLTKDIQGSNTEASRAAIRFVQEIQSKSPSEGKATLDTIKATAIAARQGNPNLPDLVIVGDDKSPRLVGVVKKDAQKQDSSVSTAPTEKPTPKPDPNNREYTLKDHEKAFTDVFKKRG
ncbi:MAG: hypothetical protein IAF58_13165 [Leptolyngbya sp.]|nr:hypothetical protein [Candidatus Melainabacteria bacterium]